MKHRATTGALLLLVLSSHGAWAAGSIERGADVFDGQCAECHSVKPGKNKKGPTLFASIGRKSATVPDYVYSDALKQSNIVWTPDKVDTYLVNPKKLVPGGKMKFDGLDNPGDRADVIAYLQSLK